MQNIEAEPSYAVFDCLYVDGRDLRAKGLKERRAELDRLIVDGTLFRSRTLSEDGLKAYREAKRRGFEGVVAKDLSSPYVQGRTRYWLKFKVHLEDEFVIAGYTAPGGARERFGALLLSAYDDGKLRYAGKVGTGFTRDSLDRLYRKFQALKREKSPLMDPPREKNVTWLSPKLVAQIAYQELTGDQKLRQPVFLGLRDDKSAGDVVFPKK